MIPDTCGYDEDWHTGNEQRQMGKPATDIREMDKKGNKFLSADSV